MDGFADKGQISQYAESERRHNEGGMIPLRRIQIAIKIRRGGATSSSLHIAVLYMYLEQKMKIENL